jgi:hypothetical protein
MYEGSDKNPEQERQLALENALIKAQVDRCQNHLLNLTHNQVVAKTGHTLSDDAVLSYDKLKAHLIKHQSLWSYFWPWGQSRERHIRRLSAVRILSDSASELDRASTLTQYSSVFSALSQENCFPKKNAESIAGEFSEVRDAAMEMGNYFSATVDGFSALLTTCMNKADTAFQKKKDPANAVLKFLALKEDITPELLNKKLNEYFPLARKMITPTSPRAQFSIDDAEGSPTSSPGEWRLANQEINEVCNKSLTDQETNTLLRDEILRKHAEAYLTENGQSIINGASLEATYRRIAKRKTEKDKAKKNQERQLGKQLNLQNEKVRETSLALIKKIDELPALPDDLKGHLKAIAVHLIYLAHQKNVDVYADKEYQATYEAFTSTLNALMEDRVIDFKPFKKNRAWVASMGPYKNLLDSLPAGYPASQNKRSAEGKAAIANLIAGLADAPLHFKNIRDEDKGTYDVIARVIANAKDIHGRVKLSDTEQNTIDREVKELNRKHPTLRHAHLAAIALINWFQSERDDKLTDDSRNLLNALKDLLAILTTPDNAEAIKRAIIKYLSKIDSLEKKGASFPKLINHLHNALDTVIAISDHQLAAQLDEVNTGPQEEEDEDEDGQLEGRASIATVYDPDDHEEILAEAEATHTPRGSIYAKARPASSTDGPILDIAEPAEAKSEATTDARTPPTANKEYDIQEHLSYAYKKGQHILGHFYLSDNHKTPITETVTNYALNTPAATIEAKYMVGLIDWYFVVRGKKVNLEQKEWLKTVRGAITNHCHDNAAISAAIQMINTSPELKKCSDSLIRLMILIAEAYPKPEPAPLDHLGLFGKHANHAKPGTSTPPVDPNSNPQ